MDSVKINSGNTLMIAHRGLSGIEMENTNAAFIAAGNRSYFGIETDVHKTADGKFVVIHDDDTSRVSDFDYCVEATVFEVLRSINLHAADGTKGRADMLIPTLKEYISTCKRYEKIAVLELKNEFTSDEIKAICDEINEEEYLDKVIFISFCFENLVRLRDFYPQQTVQFLTSEYTEDLPELLASHKFDLDIAYRELTKDRIDTLHSKGIKVNCWTCNDKAEGEELCNFGIDYITSNILE